MRKGMVCHGGMSTYHDLVEGYVPPENTRVFDEILNQLGRLLGTHGFFLEVEVNS